MQTLKAIQERRTAHRWAPSTLSEQDLQTILQAGHMAPCHKLTWPWRFFVVGPRARAELADLAVEVSSKGDVLPEPRQQAIRAKILGPAALVVLGQKLADDDLRRKEDYAALSCAQQNMALAAWDLGYASKWSTGKVTRDPGLYRLLGVDPEDIRLEGFFFVGKAADETKVKRPDVGEVVVRVD